MNRTAVSFIAPGLLLGAVLLGLAPLVWFGAQRGHGFTFQLDSSVLKILVFTLKQAFLSTLISVVIGVLAARAFARRQFIGRNFVLGLFSIPLALPAIVAVLAVSSVYGNQGWLGGLINIYGLNGILLAHVFFNAPLATRLFMTALDSIAPENFRLAEQLGFSDFAVLRHVEFPVIRNALPQICALIFLLCAASFVVVLTLGGPSATTLEVAIYQSLRQDFDVARAINLAFVQIALSIILTISLVRMAMQPSQLSSYKTHKARRDGGSTLARFSDAMIIAIALAIIIPPIAALAMSGIPYLNFNLSSLATSFLIGTGSAILTILLSWPLARRQDSISHLSSIGALIVPPVVLATGWFLALRAFNDSSVLATATIIALNVLMALPFVVPALAPQFAKMNLQHDMLCKQLGLRGWNKFRNIEFPIMRKSLRQAGLIAFILSLGDLTAVTLLGSQGLLTLPLLIRQQMGHYRGNEAAGSALVLAAFCYGLTLLSRFHDDRY
jgi:thiamine transport system permease protein